MDTEGYRAVDFFKLSFPDELFILMTDQSNLYGTQFVSNTNPPPPSSIFHNAKEITLEEMQAYVALQISMGLCCKPELSDYWRQYLVAM